MFDLAVREDRWAAGGHLDPAEVRRQAARRTICTTGRRRTCCRPRSSNASGTTRRPRNSTRDSSDCGGRAIPRYGPSWMEPRRSWPGWWQSRGSGSQSALREIASMVHEADVDDDHFHTPEAAGPLTCASSCPRAWPGASAPDRHAPSSERTGPCPEPWQIGKVALHRVRQSGPPFIPGHLHAPHVAPHAIHHLRHHPFVQRHHLRYLGR
jgi:hypothetical protein